MRLCSGVGRRDLVGQSSAAATADNGYFQPPDDAPAWAGLRWTDGVVHYVIDKTGNGPNTDSCGSGSFYNYFKSKDDLGIQALQRYTDQVCELFERMLG